MLGLSLAVTFTVALPESILAQLDQAFRISDVWPDALRPTEGDAFGTSVTSVGDVDGDGVIDLAVGAAADNDGGPGRGAVWILFMQRDGSIREYRKLSDESGGFGGPLRDGDFFGRSVASLGDLNRDGTPDLVIGAFGDDDGGSFRGAVWVVFLNPDATVQSHQKISGTEGDFSGTLRDGDQFGISVHSPGDLNSDQIPDLAVGAIGDDDGGTDRGAVWLLLLNRDGSVKDHRTISASSNALAGRLGDGDNFGMSITSLAPRRGQAPRLVIGARGDDDGGPDRGALWIVTVDSTGSVAVHTKISSTSSGLDGRLRDGDSFGFSVAAQKEIESGSHRVVVGAPRDGANQGAVWILRLADDGAFDVRAKVDDRTSSLESALQEGDLLGFSVATIPDLDGDGLSEYVVGAQGAAERTGDAWLLFGSFSLSNGRSRP